MQIDSTTPKGTRYTMVSFPSSRERANVHRTFAFKWFESLLHKEKIQIPEWVSGFLVRRKGLETLRIRSVKPSRAALIRAAIYGSHPSRYKNNPNPQMWFGLFFFGFDGNYGYNSRQQFEKYTPVTKFAPQAIRVYPKKYRKSLGYPLDKLKFTELSYTGVPTSIRFPSKS